MLAVFLTDCPNVPELHIKFDEAFKLVNLSGEQYEQILQVVQRHTEDTSYLLNKMKERFGWVSELSNMTIGPENIFNIVKVRVIYWRELLHSAVFNLCFAHTYALGDCRCLYMCNVWFLQHKVPIHLDFM